MIRQFKKCETKLIYDDLFCSIEQFVDSDFISVKNKKTNEVKFFYTEKYFKPKVVTLAKL